MIHLPERAPDLSRVWAFAALITVGLFGLIARLWYLQVAHGEELLQASMTNQRRLIRRVPPRGQIQDRSGRVLASNRQQIVVSVVPYEIRKNPEVLPLLASLIGVPAADLEAEVEPFKTTASYDAVRVAEDVDIDTVTRIEEQKPSLPGVYIYPEPVRFYPDGPLLGHVLGQMGQIQQDELTKRRDEGYRPGDSCGKLGLEKAYDAALRGTNGGREIEVDARGRTRGEVSNFDPVPGATLTLNIDKELQKVAYDELHAWAAGQHKGAAEGGNPGAAVALDPQTGAVLAMVSMPSYDPNEFVKGISGEDWKRLQAHPLKPQINRAVGSKYAPGSTFKLITALAGLETGEATPHSTDHCGGSISLGRWRKRCHKASGHGGVNFYTAIAKSCDVFFYHLGQRLGPKRMAEYARRFGLGEKSGIDLPFVEDGGVVPTEEWKLKHKRGPWVGGDTVDFAIGQASLATTPLQMCNATATIANGGTVLRPQLVKTITRYNAAGKPEVVFQMKPEMVRKCGVKPQSLQEVIQGMRDVMSPGGTGARSAIPGINIAGKTGTAQVSYHGVLKNNAWFVGYAPVEKPRIAICIFIEHGGHGGDAAAPIARKLFATYFHVKTDAGEASGQGD